MHGDRTRRQMIVVEFPGVEVFEQFIDEAETRNIHPLRENSTADYIWTLYDNRDMKAWVREKADSGLSARD